MNAARAAIAVFACAAPVATDSGAGKCPFIRHLDSTDGATYVAVAHVSNVAAIATTDASQRFACRPGSGT